MTPDERDGLEPLPTGPDPLLVAVEDEAALPPLERLISAVVLFGAVWTLLGVAAVIYRVWFS